MSGKIEAYSEGYRVGRKDKYSDIAEHIREYAEDTTPQKAYEDLFAGEPTNYVQDLREEMPIKYETERDGELAHAWDAGAFDALLGRRLKSNTADTAVQA